MKEKHIAATQRFMSVSMAWFKAAFRWRRERKKTGDTAKPAHLFTVLVHFQQVQSVFCFKRSPYLLHTVDCVILDNDISSV